LSPAGEQRWIQQQLCDQDTCDGPWHCSYNMLRGVRGMCCTDICMSLCCGTARLRAYVGMPVDSNSTESDGMSVLSAGDASHAEPQQHVSSAAGDDTPGQPGRSVGCAHTVQESTTSLVSSRTSVAARCHLHDALACRAGCGRGLQLLVCC
jgi:hypothetical protein